MIATTVPSGLRRSCLVRIRPARMISATTRKVIAITEPATAATFA